MTINHVHMSKDLEKSNDNGLRNKEEAGVPYGSSYLKRENPD